MFAITFLVCLAGTPAIACTAETALRRYQCELGDCPAALDVYQLAPHWGLDPKHFYEIVYLRAPMTALNLAGADINR